MTDDAPKKAVRSTKARQDFLGEVEPAKSSSGHKASEPKVTVKMAEGLVGGVQLLLANLPWTREDALSDLEQKLLVKDVVAFAQVNPFFARIVLWLFGNLGQAGLPIDVGAMVAKRLARRDLVPAPVAMGAEIAIIVSAAAHDIELSEDQAALASLFGGLMSSESEPPSEVSNDTEPAIASATPDLVSLDLRA